MTESTQGETGGYRAGRLWAVWFRSGRGGWWYLAHWTLASTRADSIGKWDAAGGRESVPFAKERRRGIVRCVQIEVAPLTPRSTR